MEKNPNPNPQEHWDPKATTLCSICRCSWSLHLALLCCSVLAAGMLSSQDIWGLLSAAPEEADSTNPDAPDVDVLLEPGAGCCLWPLVLQTLSSAHADANQGLQSTQLSAFDAGAWLAEPLCTRGRSGQTCLFLHRDRLNTFSKAGIGVCT